MSDTDLQIVATDVLFYHLSDERAFFEWLDRMPFVHSYRGVVRDLLIEFSRVLTYDDLWEIIGFCRRYAIERKQLESFVTDENRHWLPEAIGYDSGPD